MSQDESTLKYYAEEVGVRIGAVVSALAAVAAPFALLYLFAGGH